MQTEAGLVATLVGRSLVSAYLLHRQTGSAALPQGIRVRGFLGPLIDVSPGFMGGVIRPRVGCSQRKAHVSFPNPARKGHRHLCRNVRSRGLSC